MTAARGGGRADVPAECREFSSAERERFAAVRDGFMPGSDGGIGTLGEKTLHAVLKLYLEPDPACREVKCGRYFADIARGTHIIEIQTRSFDRLRSKLACFLEENIVTVVYPLPRVKYLCWLNDDGEVTPRRKSPKTGSVYDAFYELYKIKPYLTNAGLHVRLLLMDVTEYRYLDGWSLDKKRGSTRCERLPDNIVCELALDSPADYYKLVPQALAERFTVKDYARAAHISQNRAGTALNILGFVGAVERVGKSGNAYVYSRMSSARVCEDNTQGEDA